jgi:predicted regulator of Ras-like GTPase activity (Roadblock/LC7/MglB family)
MFRLGLKNLMATRTDRLTKKLKELELSSPDIEGAAIASSDGYILASVLPVGADATRVSAISAQVLSAAERCVTELNRGGLSEVYVKGSEGYILMRSIRENAVLIVLAREDANIGVVFPDMRIAANELKDLIDYGRGLLLGYPLKQNISLEFIYVDADIAKIKDEHFFGYIHIFKVSEVYGDFELIIFIEKGKVIGCEESHHGFKKYGEKAFERIFEEGKGYLDIFKLTEEQLNAVKKWNPEAIFNVSLDVSQIFIPEAFLKTSSDKYVVGDKLVATLKLKMPVPVLANVNFSIFSDEKCLFAEEKGVMLSREVEKEYKASLDVPCVAKAVARITAGGFEWVVEKEIEVRPLDFQLFATLDKDSYLAREVLRCTATTRISTPEYLAGRKLWMVFQLFVDGKLQEGRKREVPIQEETVLEEYFKLNGESAGSARLAVSTIGGVEKSVELPFEIIDIKTSLEREKKVYNVDDEFLGILNISISPPMKRDVDVSFSLTVEDEEIYSESDTIPVEGNTRREFRTIVEKAGKANAVASVSFEKLKRVVESSFEILAPAFKLSAELDKNAYVIGDELRCVAMLVIPEQFMKKRLKIIFQLFLDDKLLETQERGVLVSGADHVEEFRTPLNATGSALVVVSAQKHTVELPFKVKKEFFDAGELSTDIKRMLKEEGLEHLILEEKGVRKTGDAENEINIKKSRED